MDIKTNIKNKEISHVIEFYKIPIEFKINKDIKIRCDIFYAKRNENYFDYAMFLIIISNINQKEKIAKKCARMESFFNIATIMLATHSKLSGKEIKECDKEMRKKIAEVLEKNDIV